ncbi:MAG: DUF3854 domain-containing protein, partial [Candidatus Omnitrophica bacterium]|nr:DUF3854 domain-containing protein [Candidatus Omnitrophota bacterium]
VWPIVSDVSVPIFIAEGAKKALKATQEGYPTIAVSGVWNWKSDGQPLNDFDLIVIKGRVVFIVFDGDKFKNESVMMAEHRLALELLRRGADVRIVNLPPKKGLDKLDDYLVRKSNADFDALRERALSYSDELIHRIPDKFKATEIDRVLRPLMEYLALQTSQAALLFIETELRAVLRERCNYKLTAKMISTLCKEIDYKREQARTERASKPVTQDDLRNALKEETKLSPIHPAQDYAEGTMSFYAPFNDKNCLITSEQKIITFGELEAYGFYVKPNSTCKSGFSKKGALRFLDGKFDANAFDTYMQIKRYLDRHISFTDSVVSSYLVLWILGTYCFRVFKYYPYIWVCAPKNSGKSLLLEVMSSISFNSCLAVSTTLAVVFRSVNHDLSALFLDEAENLTSKDKTERGELISLFNSGYSASGIVQRARKTADGNFTIEEFTAFCPKMFGSINNMDDVLRSRVVKIPYMKKRPGDKILRFKNTDALSIERQKIKDQCYIFALQNAQKIHAAYSKISVEGSDHLLDRDLDIWEPIFVLASIIDTASSQRKPDLLAKMVEFSRYLIAIRKDEEITNDLQRNMLRVLKRLLSKVKPEKLKSGYHFYLASDVMDFFNSDHMGFRFRQTNALTHKLKQFRIISTQFKPKNSQEKVRIYKFELRHLQNWIERYGR